MEENKEEFARNMALLYAAWKELKGNGMLSGSDVVRNGKGVSADSSIVIHATEDYYVRLEYIILSLLLRGKEYKLAFQSLFKTEDGRKIDRLLVSVKDSPEAEPTDEAFFFDITAGYDAIDV